MADDHDLVLEGIHRLLENECDVVGKVSDGYALLKAAEQVLPDIVLLDISMPLLNGLEACRHLTRLLPRTRVIFLTMHADAAYVEEAFRVGGCGYLLKRSAASEIIEAINTVRRGGRYVTRLIDWKQPSGRSRVDENKTGAEKLTQRQREVLQLVAEGRSNKEVASLLHVSEKTIDYHKAGIKRTLMLGSTAELTQFAIKYRIIGI
jgi:DNA-binding NarL/FixJ family response regulator